jgi:hypothetical protein
MTSVGIGLADPRTTGSGVIVVEPTATVAGLQVSGIRRSRTLSGVPSMIGNVLCHARDDAMDLVDALGQ